jgi:hypothetical protein
MGISHNIITWILPIRHSKSKRRVRIKTNLIFQNVNSYAFKQLTVRKVYIGHQRFVSSQLTASFMMGHREETHIINLKWSWLLLQLATKFLISVTTEYNRSLFLLGTKYKTIFTHFKTTLYSLYKSYELLKNFSKEHK